MRTAPNPLLNLRLEQLKQAALDRHRADKRYNQALTEALEAGASYSEISRILGYSRQAVRQYVLAAGTQRPEENSDH